MDISIRQLAPTFAGEVTGVDCRRRLSPDQVAAIHAGMAEYAVLVFRYQKLTDAEQLGFTLHFVTFAALPLSLKHRGPTEGRDATLLASQTTPA